MGRLSNEAFDQHLLTEGMSLFLREWERDHPASGATREELERAAHEAGVAELQAQRAADEDRRPEETAEEAFWRALGQEQVEDSTKPRRVRTLKCYGPVDDCSCYPECGIRLSTRGCYDEDPSQEQPPEGDLGEAV